MNINLGKNKCAKQITIAIVYNNGEYFLGTNSCKTPQVKCPRGDMPSGEGYHLCEEVCHQTAHAEVNALKAAKDKARGGTMFLIGHTYCCNNCKEAMEKAGIIKTIIVGDFWSK